MPPALPATYVAHVVSPYGIGEGCDPNAAGEIGSMVGGLGLRVAIQYECTQDNGARIKEACGRAFGGHGSVAPLSWLLSTLCGMTWEDACALTADDVMNGLSENDPSVRNQLPSNVERAAVFSIKAMRRALGIADHGTPADLEGQGILVCRCLGVGDRRIREVIREGAHTATKISEACSAGTGCGSCRPDLRVLIDEELAGTDEPPPEDMPDVLRIVVARAGPQLRALGLPLTGVTLEGETLRIRTGSPAEGALVTPRSAPYIVRQVLREIVGDGYQVVHE